MSGVACEPLPERPMEYPAGEAWGRLGPERVEPQDIVRSKLKCIPAGERQRISLARAFLKKAPILILDEPTSSVDVNTEASILETMERLMEGRKSFLISHRLNALRNCDLVLQVQRGGLSVVEAETLFVGANPNV